MEAQQIYQIVKLRISSAGQKVTFRTTSRKDFTRLVGISVSVPQAAALVGSTIGIRVNEKEIFDETHEAKLLSHDTPTLAPNDRIMKLDQPAPINISKLEGVYTDQYLYSLLTAYTNNPNGGVIPKTRVSISKTYPSGSIGTGSLVLADEPFDAAVAGGALTPFGTPSPLLDFINPNATIKYPYDVRIYFQLEK